MIIYPDLGTITCSDLSSRISANKKRISDIKILELVLDAEDNTHKEVNGCYIFMNEKAAEYVGKCSSRCFVERVPSHFDPRESGWFNNYIKKAANYIYGNASNDNLRKVLVSSKEKYLSIVAISPTYDISRIEKVLRFILTPKYNSISNKESAILRKIIHSDTLLFEAMRCV